MARTLQASTSEACSDPEFHQQTEDYITHAASYFLVADRDRGK